MTLVGPMLLVSIIWLELCADRDVGIIHVIDDDQVELELASRLCLDPLSAKSRRRINVGHWALSPIDDADRCCHLKAA